MTRRLVSITVLFLLVACATSPLGRKQLRFFPSGEINQMGLAAFQQTREKTPVSPDSAENRYVSCVANAVTAETKQGTAGWEVVVFESDQVNAFALPGGKIGVYSGLLKVAQTQDQLATVIGHEVAHVLAQHANERVSTAFATSAGLNLVDAIYGGSAQGQGAMALLGLGAQVGVILPFSRAQESEADLLGLDLMAGAGFDPQQSVELWRNMEGAGSAGPPAFLSDHPANSARIKDLQKRIPQAMGLYNAARIAGKKPKCG